MNRYFIDWSLTSGGGFVVEADSEEAAERIAREVIDQSLGMEIRDGGDADVYVVDDTEPIDKHMSYFRIGAHGVEPFTPDPTTIAPTTPENDQ
jgi:hypothetical protein